MSFVHVTTLEFGVTFRDHPVYWKVWGVFIRSIYFVTQFFIADWTALQLLKFRRKAEELTVGVAIDSPCSTFFLLSLKSNIGFPEGPVSMVPLNKSRPSHNMRVILIMTVEIYYLPLHWRSVFHYKQVLGL